MVRGFQQVPGVNFLKTFATTAALPTWRVILAFTVVKDLEIKQVNFIGVFLNAGVDVNLYIEVPKGLYKYSLSSTTTADLLKCTTGTLQRTK